MMSRKVARAPNDLTQLVMESIAEEDEIDESGFAGRFGRARNLFKRRLSKKGKKKKRKYSKWMKRRIMMIKRKMKMVVMMTRTMIMKCNLGYDKRLLPEIFDKYIF